MAQEHRRFTPVLIALLLSLVAGAGAQDASGWVNVQEAGASGSEFTTAATTTGGAKEITVADVGDFAVGQGAMITKCHLRHENRRLWEGSYASKDPGDAIELRGFDGSRDGWAVFVLDFDGTDPLTFRWSDDVARTWQTKVPVTFDWQPLSCGVEIKFSRREWEPGNVISFDARDRLFTVIEKIDGNVLTLRDAANQSVQDAVVYHEDSAALQAIVAAAVKDRRNVFFPPGRYRLRNGITVNEASGITIQGANADTTILDISQGTGRIFRLRGGTEVTIRNLRMVGHSGLAEKAGYIVTAGYGIWGMNLKPCNAVSIGATERVLIENVHASRMATECFYAGGPGREGATEPPRYVKSITYLRCSVSDCGFNAFNNNDMSESTSMLYCRVENIGNCFWEGPGRFIRISGCYARNAGVCSVGNMFHRYEHLHDLGVAQTIISDNVFEGVSPNAAAIHVGHCVQQVVISDNLFVNYGSSGIHLDPRDKADFNTVVGGQVKSSYPARHIVVSGNVLDLTNAAPRPATRFGMDLGLSDTVVSGNQIYVRGDCDPSITGIILREPATNLSVHDNLVRNLGVGLVTARVMATVGQVADESAFWRKGAALPLEWRNSHLYRGWELVWLKDDKPDGVSIIETFDPDTLQFRLREPRQMKVGDAFEVHPPLANWSIHHNTFTACRTPAVLDCYGSPSSTLEGNLFDRGGVTGVTAVMSVRGRFNLIGNHFYGFDEPGSVALTLLPDYFGKHSPNLIRGNLFDSCSVVLAEASAEPWRACSVADNVYVNCGSSPQQGG